MVPPPIIAPVRPSATTPVLIHFCMCITIVSFADDTGEVNGIAQGADGRLYVGISAPCNACTPTKQYSASVVSFLPDGSDLQVVADGIRAAVGLAFFPGTDDLFVTMNQRDDLGSKTPGDWLVGPGPVVGLPGLLRTGRRQVPRRADADRGPREARR